MIDEVIVATLTLQIKQVYNSERRVWLLVIYTKAVRGNIPAHILKTIKEAL